MSEPASCLYLGRVVHRRVRPRAHLLHYRVFCLYADLDEFSRLDRELRWFSHNRRGLFSFHDRDHGTGEAGGLRHWIEHHLARAGIALDGGPIRVLCYPRLLGFVFNPLTVYFCHHRSGMLAAILYEVHNTFGQRHSYLIPVGADAGAVITQRCAKEFYVSPFIATGGTYSFRVMPPAERVAIAITQGDDDGPLLHASFTATRARLDDRSLRSAFVHYPLMTLKVVAGIHWEALRLWRKGVPLADRPPPPATAVTIVAAAQDVPIEPKVENPPCP